MNLSTIKAHIEQNKKGLALAGAGAVAGLALLNSRSGKASAPAPAAGAGPTTGSQYGLAPLPATGAAGVYDSSSSDVYNAIQPQLEELGQMLGKLQQEQAPIPVAAPPPAKHKGGFYQVAGTGQTFLQDERGALDFLDAAEMRAYNVHHGGARTDVINVVPKDSSFWREASFLGTNPFKK